MPLWYPTCNEGFQAAHFFAATTIGLLCRLLKYPAISCICLILAFALVKEFVFDILVEQDTWANSLEDFLYYLVGALVCGLLFRFLSL